VASHFISKMGGRGKAACEAQMPAIAPRDWEMIKRKRKITGLQPFHHK
jgi:hypothetical protein